MRVGGDGDGRRMATVVVTGMTATAPNLAHVCSAFSVTNSLMRSHFILLATLPGTDLSRPHFTDGKAEFLSNKMTCSAVSQLERQGLNPGL